MRLCIVAAVMGLAVVPRAAAEPGARPPDYANTDHLSQPVHEATVRESFFVEMRDGARIFAQVTRPAGSGRWGTIVELSPYHGNLNNREGGGTIAGGLVDYFVPRGYALVVADLRGTGNSDGCLDLLGPNDRADAYELVEWAARQPWSNGRIGMAGVSYPASASIMAAGARPPHLRTIVAVAGIARAYDHQAQGGVPYFAHWVGLATYEALATVPPDPAPETTFVRAVADTGCGAQTGAPASTGRDYLSGRYLAWHDAHDWRAAAAAADIPVFVVQGSTDIAVRPIAIEWFARRQRPGDKIWLGQWGHQASNRAEQWTGVLHRWFDRHLQGRRVDTGPPVEMFMSPVEETIRTGTVWPPPSSRRLTLYAAPGGALATSTPVLGTATLVARPDNRHVVNIPAAQGGVVFESAPLTADVAVAGFPEMRLNVTFDAPSRIDLIMTVFAVRGTRVTRLTQGALNPELRESMRKVVPISPGVPMTLSLPTFATDYVLRKGERLRVVVNSVDGDKLPFFSGPGRVTIHLGGPDATRVVFPVVDSPSLYPDFRDL